MTKSHGQQPREIHPRDLLDMLESGAVERSRILDVRELHEWDYYHLEGTLHIPMNSIPERLDELPAEEDIYIMCAHGVRSMHVYMYLQNQGYTRLWNVTGGISAAASELGLQYD